MRASSASKRESAYKNSAENASILLKEQNIATWHTEGMKDRQDMRLLQ